MSYVNTNLPKPTVLVVNCSGFLGSHIVHQLLNKGHHVLGTVHRAEDKQSFAHLFLLPHSNSHLQLIALDLLDPKEAWNKAFVDTIETVFFVGTSPDCFYLPPEEELVETRIRPNFDGIKKICELCHETISVKKLIMTSCLTALADAFVNGRAYNELDWNDVSTVKHNPIAYCKTKTELYAYQSMQDMSDEVNSATNVIEIQRTSPVTLVTILPGSMLGPPVSGLSAIRSYIEEAGTFTESTTDGEFTTVEICWREAVDDTVVEPFIDRTMVVKREDIMEMREIALTREAKRRQMSSSHRFVMSYLNGKNRNMIPNLYMNIADVRDVANCHIMAMEGSQVQGRYILTNAAISHSTMLQYIHDHFNTHTGGSDHVEIKLPTKVGRDGVVRMAASFDKTTGKGEFLLTHLGRNPSLNTMKAREAGMTVRPASQSVIDSVKYYLEEELIEQSQPSGCVIC